MWIVTVAILMTGGALGAANLIVSKREDARDWLEVLTPYQGLIGIIMLIWGLGDAVGVARLAGALSQAPIWWTLYALTAATELGLGFLLGYGLLSKHVLQRHAAAAQHGERIRTRLAGYQAPLGVTAMGLAMVFVVVTVLR